MEILLWDDIGKEKLVTEKPVAATIGVFDGLHPGHQRLLAAVKERAPGIASLVITFTNNPVAVLHADSFSGDINSYHQKLKNFQLYGIDILVLIDFSVIFSKMSGKEFWNTLLKQFRIIRIVAGEDFNFGNKRDTNIRNLPYLVKNCEITVIRPVEDKGEVVSSTKIRQWIQQGEIKKANALLFQKYALDLQDSNQAGDNFILKMNLKQVIPESGIFRVVFHSGENWQEGTVEISEEMIRLSEFGSLHIADIQEIIFIEKA